MPLVLHHLRVSQSERIVWLLEEVSLPYILHNYNRSPLLSPPELKAIPGNALGSAPVLQDFAENAATPSATLCESGAIVEYILNKYSPGSSLAVLPTQTNYADYLYWFHAANATLQVQVSSNMRLASLGIAEDNPARAHAMARLKNFLAHMNARLAETKAFLAGAELTAADIMSVCSLSTMRYFYQYSLEEYPEIVSYLGRIGERPAYRRAMEKGDPGMELVLGAKPPAKSFIEMVGGWP